MAVLSDNTLTSPCLFPCHWMLSQLGLWSYAVFAWQRCVSLCPAEFPGGSRKQQVPKVLVSPAGMGWEGAGMLLTTATYEQQLLEQAGLFLGVPFCRCKPPMRLSKNELVSACARGLWCCRLSSSSQGAKCPRDPLQDWLYSGGGQGGLKAHGGDLQCFRPPFPVNTV